MNDLNRDGVDEQQDAPEVSYSIDDPKWLAAVEAAPMMVRYAVTNADGLDAGQWTAFRTSVLVALQQFALDATATDTADAQTAVAGLQVQYVVPDGSDDLVNVLRYLARKAGLTARGALSQWNLTDYKQL